MERPHVIEISTRTILNVIGILVGLAVLYLIRDIVLSVFVAILMAGVLYPFAEWAQRHRIPKGLAIVFVYIVLAALVIAVIGFLIPALLDQARLLESSLGGTWGWLRELIEWARETVANAGLPVAAPTSAADFASQLQLAVTKVFATLTDFIHTLANAVIVLVLSFYIIIEDHAVKQLFKHIIPEPYQEFSTRMVEQVVQKLGDWFRGQLVLSLVVAVSYFIAFSIIGVPYALLLALLAALLEFIPYLGPFLAAIPAVFLALTVSPWKALAVLVVIILVQQAQNNILVPMVMRKAVGLNPVVSIISFLVGAQLFGAVGAVFAIPVVTAMVVVWDEWARFRNPQNP